MQPRSDYGALIVFLMIGMLVLPAALTLSTVKDPGTLEISADDPTPLGYTWSLSLFIFPLLVLGWWFARHPDLSWQRRAFLWTLGILLPLGFLLDLLFGSTFFTFPNQGAVLGIEIPAVGGKIPIEEFVFYLTGFLFVLLFYVWCDEYWTAAYNEPDYESKVQQMPRLVQFHGRSIVIGVILLVLAVIYKKFFSADPDGFPWYFTYLLAVSVIPSAGFFRSANPFVNWRGFSVAFFFVLLVSLLWEATLASPYGWWGYQPEMMMGMFIGAWRELPVEAVCVWLAVSYTTVIVFEIVKLVQASDRGLGEVLFGGD